MIRLWDTNTFQIIAELTGHTDSINDLFFAKNSRFLFSAGNDKTVKLWDLQSNNLIESYSQHDDRISAMALNKQGNILATGNTDNRIHFWDTTYLSFDNDQRSYFLSINKEQRDIFYGLNRQKLSNFLRFDSKEGRDMWRIKTRKNRVQYISYDKENRNWHRLFIAASRDMEQYLNQRYPKAKTPPFAPFVDSIPAPVSLPKLPALEKISKQKFESKSEFYARLDKVKINRKKQIELIKQQFLSDVTNNNKVIVKLHRTYRMRYKKYIRMISKYNQIESMKIKNHEKKLKKRRDTRILHSKEAQVLENRFF